MGCNHVRSKGFHIEFFVKIINSPYYSFVQSSAGFAEDACQAVTKNNRIPEQLVYTYLTVLLTERGALLRDFYALIAPLVLNPAGAWSN